MKTEEYWVEMACPPADILLALHTTTQQDMVYGVYGIIGFVNSMVNDGKCGMI